MKVTIRTSGEPWSEDESCEVLVDGQTLVALSSHLAENSEDATLGRDLNFIFGLPEALRKAHAAGAAGEPFELEEIKEDSA